MPGNSATPVVAVALAGAAASVSGIDGFVVLTFTAADGQTIELRIGKADAGRLIEELRTVLAINQPSSRRRYRDIKPGSLRGS
jgi:hypothetical protein